MNEDSKKIPVLFQPLKDFNVQDTRFTKVKIWLMHLEENLNGSVFTKEVVEKAIPTLALTPIMGLLNDDSGDFEGHALTIAENADGELALKNLTVPYGVIPETNQAQFEDRVGDDGVTRTYLTVEGLLWNKWEEGVNAIKNKGGTTGQSMEITDYDGFTVQEGQYAGLNQITDFKFDGACLLGDDVAPAMKNSTVELTFSDKVSEIINDKLAVYATSNDEGGLPLEDKDKFEETEDKTNPEETQEETPVEGADEGATEETPKEPETPEEPKEEEEEKPVEPEEDPKEEEESEESETEEEVETKKEETITDARKATQEHDDQIVRPAEARITIGENVYTLDEAKEIMEAHFELVKELHKEKIDDLFASHSESLTEDEISKLKETAYTKTVEEVENSIFAVLGRKAFNSGKNKEEKSTTFSAVKVTVGEDTSEPYGGIFNRIKPENK